MRFAVVALVAIAVVVPTSFAAEQPSVLAKVGDKQITREQVMELAATKLAEVRQKEYEELKAALDQLVEQSLVADAAAKEGKSPDAWRDEQIEKKLVTPTDAEIEAAYNQYKSRLGGQTLEQAKPQLSNFLKNQQRQKLFTELMTDLRSKNKVQIFLDPPRTAMSDGGRPFRGAANAPVTIIEFSEYQCPFCSRVEVTLKQILDTYGDKVKIVFRDFPLAFHRNAPEASEAAGCAEEQGKFWEMHDVLFANQQALDAAKLPEYAQQIGLDAAKFKDCMDSNRAVAKVDKDIADGKAGGVQGTPAFFINGRFLSGARPFESFAEVIDDELSRKGLPIPPKPASVAAAPRPVAPPAAPAAAPPAAAKPATPPPAEPKK